MELQLNKGINFADSSQVRQDSGLAGIYSRAPTSHGALRGKRVVHLSLRHKKSKKRGPSKVVSEGNCSRKHSKEYDVSLRDTKSSRVQNPQDYGEDYVPLRSADC